MAAIFAGNGIVLKCSENVVWSSGWFIEVIKTCLRACGHSPELVQVSLRVILEQSSQMSC
jgi:acyl-CoA reductase-like NAD-dependent aldehyde dehydrogenase